MIDFKEGTRSTPKTFLGGIGMFLLIVLLAACSDTTSVQSTPTAVALQFTTINLGIASKALNAPITGNVPDSQVLHVGVSFKLNQDLLNKLKNQKAKKGTDTNATSIANQLGITDEEYQRIKAYFGVQDATLKLGKVHSFLSIDAKASTFAKLFQTRFVTHKLNGKTFFTPDPAMPPKLPTAIANQILAITGLDNYSAPAKTGIVLKPHTIQRATKSSTTRKTADCTSDSSTLSIQQIAHAYGYDSYWSKGYHGEGLTVNLVENDTFNSDDVTAFFSCVNFPQNHFNVFNIDGTPTNIAGESTLDIDMIAGLAPGATINDYQAGDTSFADVNDMLQQIINDNANTRNSSAVVSISLGGAEGNLDQNTFQSIDSSIQQLTSVYHMTVFVASGDCGAFTDEQYNDLSVSFPASDTYAVAVGGTELQVDDNGNRNQEAVWSNGSNTTQCNNSWGSGGGVSTIFSQPQWQQRKGVSNQYTTGKRQMPDIAAAADNIPIFFNGQWTGAAGTSAATPIWAAGMVIVNQALIQNTKGTFVFGPDVFYTVANSAGNAQPLFDITQGNNLYYSATPGWDNASGFGTPNLIDFGNVIYNLVQQQQ